MKNYDLIVIGAGSGGVRTARWAAGLGAKVAICEKDERFGGTCVLRGCVPKKLMIYASEFGKEIEIAQNFGWNMQGSFEWKKFKDIREKELNRLSEIYQGLLDNKSVDIYSGVAQFQDSNTLKIKDQTISAPKIVIATGSRPFIPNCEGNELAWSSNDVFLTDSQPKSILVVGGGFIAVEFAGILRGLGSKVSLALRKDTILTGFDSESCKFLQEEISKKSIEILSQHQVSSLKKIGDQIEVQFQNGLQKIFDRVLFATGRVPNTHHLGLEKTKVELNSQGAIQVDSHFQTNDPSIYALGDVIDKVNLTPVATTQGTFLASSSVSPTVAKGG